MSWNTGFIISKKQLEGGYCPKCSSKLLRETFHYGCEVVESEKMMDGQWQEIKNPIISYSDWDRTSVQYVCNACETHYHTDDDSYTESS